MQRGRPSKQSKNDLSVHVLDADGVIISAVLGRHVGLRLM